MDDQELSELKDISATIKHKSHYNFLTTHRGFRDGKMHVLMGPTHAGKSTLVRSIVVDYLEFNPDRNILVWLSEESASDFATEFYASGYDPDKVDNLWVCSEQDDKVNNFNKLKEFIESGKCDMVVIDNLTTSNFYMDTSVKAQGDMAKEIKRLAQAYEVPMLIIVHTGAAAGMNVNRLLDVNDIRGSKTICNLSEFFYILQKFSLAESSYTFLQIAKHRGQEVGHKFFMLRYLAQKKMIAEDVAVKFSEVNKAFQMRVRLKDK